MNQDTLVSEMRALELATFGRYTPEFEAIMARYEDNMAKLRARTIRDIFIFLSCCLLSPIVIIFLTYLGF